MMTTNKTTVLPPKLLAEYTALVEANNLVDPSLYDEFNVKRGLRNADGSGVLVGLTNIGCVHGYVFSENEKMAVPGELLYRGINVRDIVAGCAAEGRLGYEECAYLLLFGKLPDAAELAQWQETLDAHRRLPASLKDAILRNPGHDLMNSVTRAILHAYVHDPDPDDISIENVLRQSIALVAQMPVLAAYAHQARHGRGVKPAMLRNARKGQSTAEVFLSLCRPDGKYSKAEAELLDLCLILHAEHGGGNNSAFTTRVVTSALTDTYSAIAAAMLSLKGPRHGGANASVMRMMDEIKAKVKRWHREADVADYLRKILAKKAGDGTGLIYGLGHPVYTISDPRTLMLREQARALAKTSGRGDELALYETIERIGPAVFNEKRAKPRQLCANVDFYSGFVYDMLGISPDLYTPIFAISRIVGWCAHRLEELVNRGPIVRPAFKVINKDAQFVPLQKR
jgi:citrate synthase